MSYKRRKKAFVHDLKFRQKKLFLKQNKNQYIYRPITFTPSKKETIFFQSQNKIIDKINQFFFCTVFHITFPFDKKDTINQKIDY